MDTTGAAAGGGGWGDDAAGPGADVLEVVVA
jgi:hypothetical protein